MDGVSCSWKAFADDFKLILCNGDVEGTCHPLQNDLNTVSEAASLLDMKLNKGKCVLMQFGRGTDHPQLCLEGEPLDVVPKYRDLGVIVDCKLRFHDHIRLICGRTGSMMGELLRSTICRSKEFMMTLYITHIRPTIDYCSSVWNVGYLGDVRKLESLQRRWTREIEGMGGMEYPDRLAELGLFSMYGRLLRRDLINVWRCFNDENSVRGLRDMFEMARSDRTRGHRLKISVPVCRGDLMRKFFTVRVVTLWNSLPGALVEAESVSDFKSGVQRFLGNELYKVI